MAQLVMYDLARRIVQGIGSEEYDKSPVKPISDKLFRTVDSMNTILKRVQNSELWPM